MKQTQMYTTQLQAGLGLVHETRLLLDIWQSGMTPTDLKLEALRSGQFPNVTARRLREGKDKLESRVVPLARLLLEQIVESLQGESAPRDVSVAGHLVGGKATWKFVLRHCRRRGTVNVWEIEDEWKATIKDERDEAVGVLRGLDPAESGRLQEMAPHVSRLLMEFIQKVSPP